LFSFINIFGLAIGISSCVLIFLYVNHELSYDTFHEKADRIFRVTTWLKQPKKTETFAPTSPIMAASLKENFPEVETIVRLNPSNRSISYKGKTFFETKALYADSGLLGVFSFKLLDGTAKNALTKPYSIVLTESSVKKYFGNEPAYGKLIQFSDSINLLVTGIIQDIPSNSHFSCDCFISRSTMNDMNKNNSEWKINSEENWFNCSTYSYVLLKENINPTKLQSKISSFMHKEMADIKKETGMELNQILQPLKNIHLKSHIDSEMKGTKNSDITYIHIFISTALLILIIACCNFINLSTARSLNRSKEIGLRKVIGASRKQLITQFIGESLLFTVVASALSLILVFIGLPVFNNFLGSNLTLTNSLFLLYLLIILLVGILSGLYPAILMSSFSPIQSIKGKISHGIGDVIFRKSLVVFQFSIAIILIIGTTCVLKQLNYIQNRNIGINKDQLVTFELKGDARKQANVILKALLQNPKVVNGTLNSFSFKGISNITMVPEGAAQNEMTSSSVFTVDENFMNTFQITLVAGRDFSIKIPSDVTDAFIVNEAAVKEFNWKTPKDALGKKIEWGGLKNGKVIGVVKDFNFASLRENIKPLVMHIFPDWSGKITLRLKTDNVTVTLKEIESTWKGIAANSPFEFSFEDDTFKNQYLSELTMKKVLSAFTFISILVACLGLFGLASFSIKQRVKEIGIRKVLGSTANSIVLLISKDFLKLVLIAFIISMPIAWYGIHKWLQNYAFRINISIIIFVIAGASAFLIAFLTISIQAFKAGTANPIKSLRTE
jgi:putative ABC transport system permease protein